MTIMQIPADDTVDRLREDTKTMLSVLRSETTPLAMFAAAILASMSDLFGGML